MTKQRSKTNSTRKSRYRLSSPSSVREVERAVKQHLARQPEWPEWGRLPQPGTACRYSGLRRTQLNELILLSQVNGFKPPVRSVSLRKPGAVKGTRLVHIPSLMAYLAELEAAQVAAAAAAREEEAVKSVLREADAVEAEQAAEEVVPAAQ
jgi:hypothetical protein